MVPGLKAIVPCLQRHIPKFLSITNIWREKTKIGDHYKMMNWSGEQSCLFFSLKYISSPRFRQTQLLRKLFQYFSHMKFDVNYFIHHMKLKKASLDLGLDPQSLQDSFTSLLCGYLSSECFLQICAQFHEQSLLPQFGFYVFVCRKPFPS